MRAVYLSPDPETVSAPTTPLRRRLWVIVAVLVVVLGLVATGVFAAVRAFEARGAFNQIQVLPARMVCGGQQVPFKGESFSDLEEPRGMGFLMDVTSRSTVCQVVVEVRNDSEHAVTVRNYTLPFLGRGDTSGFPMQVYARKGLTVDVRTVSDTDALVLDEAFTIPAGESQNVEWQLERRPGACLQKGVIPGAPLVVLHVSALGHDADVDRGTSMRFRAPDGLGRC